MTRWFRFYDDAINNPKVLRLPVEMRWHWVEMLCLASKGNGVIPAVSDIALVLRLTEERVTEIVTLLVTLQLLERYGERYVAHDWQDRQYLDKTAKIRMKRYREKKRNANVTQAPEQNRTYRKNTEYEERGGSLATAPLNGALRSPPRKLTDIPAISPELRGLIGKRASQ